MAARIDGNGIDRNEEITCTSLSPYVYAIETETVTILVFTYLT